jgi:hypothetical protein
MINSLTFASLRNVEFISFCTDAENVIDLNDPAALKIAKSLAKFKTNTKECNDIYDIDKKNPYTIAIQNLDFRRDQAIIGIQMVIEGYTYYFDDAVKKSALALLDSIKMHGPNIARMNYQAETGVLKTLVGDWATKPAYSAAITFFNLTAWVKELTDANQEFTKKFAERAQDSGSTANDTKFKEKRVETTASWNKLRDLIESQYNVKVEEGDGEEKPYLTLINSLNALIDKYNVLVNTRSSKSSSSDAKDAGTSTTANNVD